GAGFIEGHDTEYRFGTTVIPDPETGSGPDSQARTDARVNGNVNNELTTLTVPLLPGSSGPIVVKTAGGTSAPFSVGFTGIASVALSGTPADPTQASANPGQAITLVGSGLSSSTVVLLRTLGSDAKTHMFLLHALP